MATVLRLALWPLTTFTLARNGGSDSALCNPTFYTKDGFSSLWLGGYKGSQEVVTDDDHNDEGEDVAGSEPLGDTETGPVAEPVLQESHPPSPD